MSLLGIGASLVGGLLGKKKNKSKSRPSYSFDEYEGDVELDYEMPDYLKDVIGDLQKPPTEYEGDLTTDMSDSLQQAQQGWEEGYGGELTSDMPGVFDQLLGNVESQLSGENLGMSDEEMSTYMGEITRGLEDKRQDRAEGRISNLNDRGILSSTMTSQGLADVEEGYADALTSAQANMFLENEAAKRQQMNRAMEQGMSLGQWQQQSDLQNKQNKYQDFLNQQQGLEGIGRFETQLDQTNKQNEYKQFLNQQQRQDQYNSALANLGQWQSQFESGLEQQNIQNQLNKFQMNEGFRQSAAGIGQNQQRINAAADQRFGQNIGSGIMIGSNLGEGTSVGSGWGGAIGGLIGGMFG